MRDGVAVAELLSTSLVEAGVVDAAYSEAIRSHLSSSPPAYGHIAIVHPLTDGPEVIHDSAVAVWVGDSPIGWFGSEVSVVLMLAVRSRDAAVVQDVFNWVLRTGPDASIEWLTGCTDVGSFVAALSGTDQ